MKKGDGRFVFAVFIAAGVTFLWLGNIAASYQPPEQRWVQGILPMLILGWGGVGRARRVGLSGVWGVLCGLPFLGLLLCLGLLIAPDKKVP
jgi:hypothetical protein